MFRNLKDKTLIKQYLIFFNIALGIILSVLLTSWFAYVRPSQINLAIAQNQYGYYDIKNLPNKTGEVEVDYFGKSKIVDLENTNDVASDDSEYVKPSSLVNKEEELDKTNKLLVSSEEKKQELLGEGGEPLSLTSEHTTSKPKIALIITNLGLNRKSTELALTLPSECALGFLPYTKTLKPLLNKAQNKGHEIYLYLPLQTTQSSDNHGKHALTTSLPPEEMALRLHLILNSHIKYDGVYSNYKEVFTDNIKASTSC